MPIAPVRSHPFLGVQIVPVVMQRRSRAQAVPFSHARVEVSRLSRALGLSYLSPVPGGPPQRRPINGGAAKGYYRAQAKSVGRETKRVLMGEK